MPQHAQHPIGDLRERYDKNINKLNKIFSSKEYIELTDIAPDDLPLAQVENFLANLDEILLDADKAKYRRAFLKFITELKCFKFHIFDKGRPQRIWNPLDESFEDFAQRAKSLDYHVSDTPYPPTEVIIRWIEV